MYNITVMDQYSPAIVTVPANMSSVEISQFPYNGTSIVANREYTITVSAVSDQGTNYPSDPVVVGKFSCTYTNCFVDVCTYIHMHFMYTKHFVACVVMYVHPSHVNCQRFHAVYTVHKHISKIQLSCDK